MSDTELLKFPCDIGVKAIGKGQDELEGVVLEIVRLHVADTEIESVRTNNSRNGRYQSITVTVRAESRAQLDAIYQALSDHDKVVMAL